MKPTQAIQDKAIELSALYAAVANGRELQWDQRKSYDEDRDWSDPGNASPGLRSDLSRWRVKPEPRTVLLASHPANKRALFIEDHEAAKYREAGCVISKWTEVLS
jgi:hypothetical protein